ncbi:uncharacterized protein SETTUDRAFT_86285 [Exserohilum turcica Et28A]|uniref:F-box domain-containing protein n=1 Tax=Exserohilum turcicum (strain 28A) TaxID=671987 RepID=R0J3H3_EXST2|nr:uncharacterized protein SETTUDRAFT_86285 [Exserohilum turcica Et28A]EOA91510.1 hypothetical protein SETTUDRAFT_86285 [Exserohilum turcica Et28A]
MYEAEGQAHRDEQDEQDEQVEQVEQVERNERNERDKQQAQALLLTFSELQRTMDPAIAAHVYNNRFCPLIRLPNELLLWICDFLRDDSVTIYCLRLASRKLFHLLNKKRDIFVERLHFGPMYPMPDDEARRFRQLLQRDGRCYNCTRWNDAHVPQFCGNCKFQPTIHQVLSRNARDSFDDLQNTCICYSLYQQLLELQTDWQCLGQQGSVQLCEHVEITWARIKAHIHGWRQQHGGEDLQACLDSFNIECHDAIHDTRCTASGAPTWPRARLSTSTKRPDLVVLNLEWTTHRRIDALTLTADGQIPAIELRALFHGLRSLGPVDILFPSSCANTLPEMAFFRPTSPFGPFVYYKTGEVDEIGPVPTSLPPLSQDAQPQWRRRHGYGENGMDLHINYHYIKDADNSALSSQCLVVRYEKDIQICRTAVIADPDIEINPTHQWLHAMDPHTYSHPQASHVRPQCREISCVNYYRKRKDYCLGVTLHTKIQLNSSTAHRRGATPCEWFQKLNSLYQSTLP